MSNDSYNYDISCRITLQAEQAVTEFGNRRYQEGLSWGLKQAVSLLASIDNPHAREACAQAINNMCKSANLPYDLIVDTQIGRYI